MTKLKYFKPAEFNRCNPSCTIDAMDAQFLKELDICRHIAGVPFVLLSAYRSASHDIQRGRSGVGYHTSGRAVDVKCTDSEDRRAIIEGCLACGLTFGVYPSFIHIDNRPRPIAFIGK
ncbi:putative peptidase [Microviridae sp.]|nr:putative peptidase [Microviridae sp.]